MPYAKKQQDYSKIIPSIWHEAIYKRGKLFLSDQTIEETDFATLQLWMKEHFYTMRKVYQGAFIYPVGVAA